MFVTCCNITTYITYKLESWETCMNNNFKVILKSTTGAMEHKCENVCYLSGYNVCIDCGLVQNDLIIGNEYIENKENYDEPNLKKIKIIDIPRKAMIFKEINKYYFLKMSRQLSIELESLCELERSSKMIAAGYIIFKGYLDLHNVSILSGVSKNILGKIVNEIIDEI